MDKNSNPLKYPSHYPAVDRQKAKEAIEAVESISKIAKNKIRLEKRNSQ